MTARPPTHTRTSWTPLALAMALLALAITPRVQSTSALTASFVAAAAVLGAWWGWWMIRGDGPGTMEIAVRRQHWIQALVQTSVLVYWGWHWRPVYDMAPLLVGQLVFAYGVSLLIAWSRGRSYALGFGPVPIILSINLFLWFRDDWFYLQFLMIAVGFLGKEFIRWHREGRSVHVFNPSALALGLFSLALIATGTTDLTWGPEIASTLTLAPRIYTFIFVAGLVVMYFFSITLVAGTAAVALFAASAVWSAVFGVPYFVDSEIPAAVFLGLHLLITDPSTSPRKPLGKVVFGALYGIGVFALYAILSVAGVPTFYDKLLCVPLLNLSVRAIDAGVARFSDRYGDPAGKPPPDRSISHGWNLRFIGVWVLLFGAMTALGRTDGRHPGDALPFWQEACREDRRGACTTLRQLQSSYCADNSAWACNELGLWHLTPASAEYDAELGSRLVARACELRYRPACLNVLDPSTVARGDPKPLDLRLLLREGGSNLLDVPEPELRTRACEHGWSFACT